MNYAVRAAPKQNVMHKPSTGESPASSTAVQPPRGHFSLRRWGWPIAAASLVGFGLTVGIAKLAHRADAVEVRVVTVTKQATPQTIDSSNPGSITQDPPAASGPAATSAAASHIAIAAGHAPRAAKTSALRSSQVDADAAETAKPSQDPTDKSATAPYAGSRQTLDSASISRTVASYSGGVQRSCWQTALASRSPNAPPTARMTANVMVNPNGRVQSVNVSPDPQGYRGLSSCIQSKIRTWSFPHAAESTEVNVPFVFTVK